MASGPWSISPPVRRSRWTSRRPSSRTLRVEPVTGPVGVTARWREPVKPSAIQEGSRHHRSAARSRRPGRSGRATSSSSTPVRFGPQAPNGCSEVTELVPSGLVPVGGLDDSTTPTTVTFPRMSRRPMPWSPNACRSARRRPSGPDGGSALRRARDHARDVRLGTGARGVETSAGRAALTPTTTVTHPLRGLGARSAGGGVRGGRLGRRRSASVLVSGSAWVASASASG